ncbi:hypothetical protein ALT721_560012 [Alteromonas alvinellae]
MSLKSLDLSKLFCLKMLKLNISMAYGVSNWLHNFGKLSTFVLSLRTHSLLDHLKENAQHLTITTATKKNSFIVFITN